MGLASAPTVRAYGVLAHEAVIDSVWEPSIKPLLLRRFSSATPEQLKEAHAYAYGGAILQPSQHLKTEFGFDVLQVAQKDYASQSYHDYIGLAKNDEGTGKLEIENDNMGTGSVTGAGQYRLADRT